MTDRRGLRFSGVRGIPPRVRTVLSSLIVLCLVFSAACTFAESRPAGGAADRPSVTSAAGVTYQRLERPGPVIADVIHFDLTAPGLRLHSVVGPAVHGTHTVGVLAESTDPSWGIPVVAVNGDYFEFRTEPRYHGTLQGTTIENSELVSTPGAITFWVDDRDRPHLANARAAFRVTWPDGSDHAFAVNASTSDYRSEVRRAPVVLFTPRFAEATHTAGGREFVLKPADAEAPWLPLQLGRTYRAEVVTIHTRGNTPIPPDGMVLSIAQAADERVPDIRVGDQLILQTDARPEALLSAVNAIAGAPRLLADGVALPNPENINRAPRTAVGFTGSKVWLIVVDGRQPDRSIGMSHRELAELMLELGCTDAVNLDGGGSSTLWLEGRIINVPSAGEPRPVGNALVLTYRPDA